MPRGRIMRYGGQVTAGDAVFNRSWTECCVQRLLCKGTDVGHPPHVKYGPATGVYEPK